MYLAKYYIKVKFKSTLNYIIHIEADMPINFVQNKLQVFALLTDSGAGVSQRHFARLYSLFYIPAVSAELQPLVVVTLQDRISFTKPVVTSRIRCQVTKLSSTITCSKYIIHTYIRSD